ncbi:hypothetical protein [Cohnella caldifontis]|uniref:hypothetical protein n=1 Tax=Cohnella caldifontis TaxID=3027471 RepID=UPI0023EB2C90|nr:hypothetical protein [Cohnella sp. YIM B05605]
MLLNGAYRASRPLRNFPIVREAGRRALLDTKTVTIEQKEKQSQVESELAFMKASQTTKEGSVETSFTYIRLVQKPYIPQTGQSAPASMAVQNPEKLMEWKVYQLNDYVSWFQKEIDLYLWETRGFVN